MIDLRSISPAHYGCMARMGRLRTRRWLPSLLAAALPAFRVVKLLPAAGICPMARMECETTGENEIQREFTFPGSPSGLQQFHGKAFDWASRESAGSGHLCRRPSPGGGESGTSRCGRREMPVQGTECASRGAGFEGRRSASARRFQRSDVAARTTT
jgi:hypothetical protein